MDVIAAALADASGASASAPALAFAAGAASSFGPCVGPRMLALAALCSGKQRAARCLTAAIFAAGLCVGYAVVGAVAGAAALASVLSPAIYGTLAIVAVAGGVWTILRRPLSGGCRHERRVEGGIGFFAGLVSAGVTSPCCGPIGAALAGAAAASAGPRYAAEIVVAFALGHILPLALIAAGSLRFGRAVVRALESGAGATISGALMLAAGAYYAVIA